MKNSDNSLSRILFIAHDASRTGAPVVLLSLLRWLKGNTALTFDILLLKDGPLKEDFEQVARTYFIPFKYKYTLQNKIRRRLHPELSEEYKIREVIKKLSRNKYMVIYGNSIVSLPWLAQFKNVAPVKTILAIHELSYVIAFYFKTEDVMRWLPCADLIFAGSQAVADNLSKNYGVDGNKMQVIHAFVDPVARDEKIFAGIKEHLGITTELIIGGMGTADLRKGLDMVVPLAVHLVNRHPHVPFRIVWVGGLHTDPLIQLIKSDAEKCGVAGHISFVENTPLPESYIGLFDIFVLLSREDPFPLVLLTAAAMGKALIAFYKSGGAAELIASGGGFLAPYLDIGEVAEIIAGLYEYPERRTEAGEKAKQKVENEFSTRIIARRIAGILESSL